MCLCQRRTEIPGFFTRRIHQPAVRQKKTVIFCDAFSQSGLFCGTMTLFKAEDGRMAGRRGRRNVAEERNIEGKSIEGKNAGDKALPGKKSEINVRRQADEKPLGREFFARDGITVARELLGKILVHQTEAGTIRGIITEVESYMGEEDKGSHTYGGRRTERTEPMYHAGGTSYVYLIYGMYSCMNIAAMTEGIPQAVLLRSVIPADSESRERMYALRLAETERRRSRRSAAGGAEAEKTMAGRPEVVGAAEGEQEAAVEKPRATADGPEAEKAMTDGPEALKATAAASKTEIPASLKKHLADGPGKLCIAMGITRADNDIDMTKSREFYVTEGIVVKPEQIRAGKRIGIDYAEEAADYLWRFYLEPPFPER